MNIRTVLAFLAGSLLVGQSLVLTIDDGPNLDPTPKLSAQERNQRLLEAFKGKEVRVVLFANGIRGGDSDEGYRTLSAWGSAGHRIGNHTYSHPNLKEVSAEAYLEDFDRLDRLIKPLPGYWRMFRFPFLEEGKNSAEWRRIQEALRQKGYRDAPVSISTYDWSYNAQLHELLKTKPAADITPLRDRYLGHIQACLAGYRELGRELLGREATHAILLHHNLLNAMVMPDLLAMLEREGWTVVSPEVGYKDPLYQEDRADAGYAESILEAIARKRKVLPGRFEALKATLWEGQNAVGGYKP